MNDALHISQAGLNLIKEFEGCYLHAYKDAVGVLTIGYGHTNMDNVAPKVFPGQRITKAQAEEILARSLAVHYEVSVKRFVTVPLAQHQFDALVSFCYNCGEGNLKRLVRNLNKGDYKSIPRMLLAYNRAGGRVLKGLTRRRVAEVALWKSENYSPPIPTPKPDRTEPTPLPEAPAPAPEAPEAPMPAPVPHDPDEHSGAVDRADELPDKVAKWGGAVSPFGMIMAYATDWKVLAVVGVILLAAGAGYAFWRWKTK